MSLFFAANLAEVLCLGLALPLPFKGDSVFIALPIFAIGEGVLCFPRPLPLPTLAFALTLSKGDEADPSPRFCSNSSFVNEELMYDTRGADFDACEISEQNSPFTNEELFGFLFRNGSGPNSSFVNDELFRLVKF